MSIKVSKTKSSAFFKIDSVKIKMRYNDGRPIGTFPFGPAYITQPALDLLQRDINYAFENDTDKVEIKWMPSDNLDDCPTKGMKRKRVIVLLTEAMMASESFLAAVNQQGK